MTTGSEAQRRSHFAEALADTGIVTFDMDGTLYRQEAMRARMARMVATHLLWSSAGRRKIGIIRKFRAVRELLADQQATGILHKQYAMVADALGISAEEVQAVTSEWLEHRPLPVLGQYAQPAVRELFAALERAGIRLAVLSDYPARAKLEALGLSAEIVVSATDPEVDCFKPQPRGLQRVLELSGESAARCLVIGDRDERDGECARRATARYLLKVSSSPRSMLEVQHYGELVSALARP